MIVVQPWHLVGGDVYHITSDCRIWVDLDVKERLDGTDERQCCLVCLYGLVIEQTPERISELTTRIMNYRI